ncbi:MobF family relaxase [Actinotalea sp. K2]|uniref:MobF family relaxase n=1 Tax=Actinotalea sp. K2 TaxID=2939438 RepID=UPI0024B560B8|nr:MobF family relaxase [Actinotalea sp. K2]
MHKLVAGAGYAYLTRQVAAGDAFLGAGEPLVAYYEATGTPPGRWLGSGLRGLGGDGARVRVGDVVSEAGMVAVFRDGHDPVTGTALGRSFVGQVRPVVGFDLTFTVPKSAAVVWALGDERTRAAVVGAHHAALTQALGFVEHAVVRTRVGAAGCRQIRTRGMVAAGFDHYDTRAGDPGLHTHVVLANKVQGPDRVWRSLDGRTVHAATVTVSELYDGLVADELHRRLGVSWSHRPRGAGRNDAFEINGIDDKLLREFSSRADRIHEAELDWAQTFTSTHGRAPNRVETIKARAHLTRATRPAKIIRPLADLFTDWANRARACTGLEPRDLAARALVGDYTRGLHAHDIGPLIRDALITQVLKDAGEHRSVWSTWNLGAAAARVTKALRMTSPRHRQLLLDQLTKAAAGRCVHLDAGRDPTTARVGEALFTTVELLGAERVLLEAAEATDYPHPLYGWDAEALPRSPHLAGLTPDQSAAVQAVMTSPHRLDVLVGPAGTGKTTTLAALTQIARDHGRKVIGLAPSASAAHTLHRALGIATETTAKWLHEACGPGAAARAVVHEQAVATLTQPDLDRAAVLEATNQMWQARIEQDTWRFTMGQIVVVDEASLADTPTLAILVQLAEQADAKVVLVGDHRQRGPVGAGGAFGMLARRGPTAELTTLHRFTHPWEARATLELRHGQPRALDTYQAHGAIHDGDLDTIIDMALDAADTAASAGRVALLQAADLRTVRELNTQARQRAILTGHAHPDGITLHDGLVAGVGDRIITRRNDRRLRTEDGYVRNGALWHVTATHPDGSLTVDAAQPRRASHARLGNRDAHSGARGDGQAVYGSRSVRLPAPYVAEHVELGYAITTARSQGMTVDESHTIATPTMAREDLYVALTRGHHANHVYVPTDLTDHCPPDIPGTSHHDRPTARQILNQILATSHAELSATETWAAFHPLDRAPVPPPGRPANQNPRYIERLQADGLLPRARPRTSSFSGPAYSPVAPARVIDRLGP